MSGEGSGGGVLNVVIHGLIRTIPTLGQVFPKPTVSAPIQIGAKGGIRVEGIDTNVPINSAIMTDINVPNVTIQILAPNPQRNSNLIQNNGTVPVYLAFDAAAVAGAGLTLLPGVIWEAENVFQGQIQAVVTAGTARVTVLES